MSNLVSLLLSVFSVNCYLLKSCLNPQAAIKGKETFSCTKSSLEQLQIAKLKAYFFLGNCNIFNHLKLPEERQDNLTLVPFPLSMVHPSLPLGEGKAAWDYDAQTKEIVKSLWVGQQWRKGHCTLTASFCHHLAVPIPEVKPGKPNLSGQAGKLHGFGDRDPHHRKPNRLVLQDVTCTRVWPG